MYWSAGWGSDFANGLMYRWTRRAKLRYEMSCVEEGDAIVVTERAPS